MGLGSTATHFVAQTRRSLSGIDMIWYDHAPGGEGFLALEARMRGLSDTVSLGLP